VDDQPQPLDLGVHEESEHEPGVYEFAPGAEVLDSNDDMDEDNEIPFEFPDGFNLAQAPGSRMSLCLSFKKEKTVADVFLGFQIQYNWPAVGWIEGEVVKQNIDRRMKIGSDIVNFFVSYQHDQDTSKQ
jgi:hypothetical protein